MLLVGYCVLLVVVFVVACSLVVFLLFECCVLCACGCACGRMCNCVFGVVSVGRVLYVVCFCGCVMLVVRLSCVGCVVCVCLWLRGCGCALLAVYCVVCWLCILCCVVVVVICSVCVCQPLGQGFTFTTTSTTVSHAGGRGISSCGLCQRSSTLDDQENVPAQ